MNTISQTSRQLRTLQLLLGGMGLAVITHLYGALPSNSFVCNRHLSDKQRRVASASLRDSSGASGLAVRKPISGSRQQHTSAPFGTSAIFKSLLQPVVPFACAIALALSSPLQGNMPMTSAAYAEEMLGVEEQQSVGIFERSTPGVVFITNSMDMLELDAATRTLEIERVPAGSGSGWVYDSDGHIVTNYHVIQGAKSLMVKFIEGTEVKATVVGADPASDVAVLQVDLPSKSKPLLKPLARGSSSPLRVGQDVYAIGNPFGLDHTLTKGIVSGVGRTFNSVGGRPIQGAIQTDASINPGNSGGPLLNSRGQVVGMNTVILSPSGASAGVGFAIPSDTIQARVGNILKYGYVKRPSLGLYLGADGMAKRLAGVDGTIVAGYQKKSAGGKAGVRAGDIIVQINDRKINRLNDVFAELDEYQPGESVQIKLLRPEVQSDEVQTAGGTFEAFSLSVKLGEAPAETL